MHVFISLSAYLKHSLALAKNGVLTDTHSQTSVTQCSKYQQRLEVCSLVDTRHCCQVVRVLVLPDISHQDSLTHPSQSVSAVRSVLGFTGRCCRLEHLKQTTDVCDAVLCDHTINVHTVCWVCRSVQHSAQLNLVQAEIKHLGHL
eukprot:TRINITY_DN52350_c0_g1_i15.p1 TRINITY_DN52350_c0_g1~~TRINITY_DN52350_c0_g1_i15.p1  ORF type:complete len:145 (+),score=29.03 TRINITY_DN52350_c0_g1_i15:42-476(+)